MATIRDVAKASGVSTATVSNVLNARWDRVRPATRERVLTAIRELRYRPTAMEVGQAALVTRNLGVMMPDLTRHPINLHSYFRLTLDGILEVALLRGWSVTLFVEQMWDDLGTAIRRSYDGRCDGLIMMHPDPDGDTVRSLRERGVPLVLVGTTSAYPEVSSVDIDNDAAGVLAAHHLLSLGHRKFAFVGIDESPSANERERGFSRVVGEAGFSHAYRAYETTDAAIADFRRRGDRRPTGIFAWHDPSAIDLIQKLTAEGVRVPEDVSIVGVNGFNVADEHDPPLTTVPQPLYAIGKRAASLLLDRLADPSLPCEVVRYTVELQARATTGPAPTNSDIAVLSS